MNQVALPDPALRVRALLGLIGTCSLWGLSFPTMKALGMYLSMQAPGISTWFVAATTVVLRFGLGAILLVSGTVFYFVNDKDDASTQQAKRKHIPLAQLAISPVVGMKTQGAAVTLKF